MRKIGKYLTLFFKKIWLLLGRNFGLKIVALFFAVLLWSIAMAEENPWREKSLSYVPVTIIGNDILDKNNLAVTKGLEILEKGIRLNIEVRQTEYHSIDTASVEAEVDLSFIREPGQYTLKINAKGLSSGRVLDVYPSTITVNIEKTTIRTLPVVYRFGGEMSGNYWHDEPVITPSTIEIRGPVSTVEKIKSAVCIIPLNNLTAPFKEAVPLIFYDSESQIVETRDLIGDIPSVLVNMNVFYKKSVPVTMNGNILDIENVKPGYYVSDIIVSPRNIEIVGSKEILDGINGLNFEAFSIQRQSSTVIKDMPLILPAGVRALNAQSVNVIVTIKERQTETVFNKQLQYTELEKGHRAYLGVKVIEVRLKGPLSVIKNFNPSDLQLYVNLAGLTKGTYDVPVEYSITDDNNALVISISPALVTVVIE